jgi:hypothetical protein
MKYSDLTKDTTIVLDEHFSCRGAGKAAVNEDADGFFFRCAAGKHYLTVQIDYDDEGNLMGITESK